MSRDKQYNEHCLAAMNMILISRDEVEEIEKKHKRPAKNRRLHLGRTKRLLTTNVGW
jgi:hypothetical protein